MRLARTSCLSALILSLGLSATAGSQSPPGILRLIGSTAVRETNSLFIGRPGGLVIDAKGKFYVSERGDPRLLEITPSGIIKRTFGRKGNGPGELISPSALALSGDTLLAVMDNGQRRISLFDLRTGKFVSGFPVPAFLPALRFVGSELWIAAIDVPSATAVAVYALNGTLLRREGGMPATAKRFLKLTETMPFARVAIRGTQVYAAFDMSQSLVTWPRNAKVVTEIPVPVTTRWGVQESMFGDLMRNPQRARELLYHHSAPAALEVLPSGRLVLLTNDAVMAPKGNRFESTLYLPIVDVTARRLCPEVPVPVRPNSQLSLVLIQGNTLLVLEQDTGGEEGAVTTIKRFSIHDTACKWKQLD